MNELSCPKSLYYIRAFGCTVRCALHLSGGVHNVRGLRCDLKGHAQRPPRLRTRGSAKSIVHREAKLLGLNGLVPPVFGTGHFLLDLRSRDINS